MKDKKVAFLTEVPTPYRDGLFEKLIQGNDLNFEVIYCVSEEYGRYWEQGSKKYPYKILSGFRYTIVGRGKNIFTIKLNPGIWNQLAKGNYSTVIIGGYIQPTMQLAILWCLVNRVPYILWSESHNVRPRCFWRDLFKWPLVKFSITKASAFLATGSNSRDYLISYAAPRFKIFLFPNNPDIDKWMKDASGYRKDIAGIRRQLNIQGNPVIIYSGRFIGGKNLETLLMAFQLVQRRMPDVGLLIVGDGPLRNHLENLVRKLKLNNVYFAGFIQAKDLIKYYACADIFVLPSTDEPWGVVVLEAMASGLPVIVSDRVGCARDLVYPNRNGFVFSSKDIHELSSKISKLLYDVELRQQMGVDSQKIAMEWNYDFAISQLTQALRIVIP